MMTEGRAYESPAETFRKVQSVAPVEPRLVHAVTEAEAVGKLLAEAESNLSDFLERLVGPECEAEGNSTDRPSFGSGMVGELRGSIESNRARAFKILDLTRLLRSIG